MQEDVGSDSRKQKSAPDVNALQRPLHLWKHDIYWTKLWRVITLTLPSRNTVLMQPLIKYPAPKIYVACYPH